MKTLSTALAAHLQGELTTLAYLLKITRADATVLAFTTHDHPLTIDGVTYQAAESFMFSQLEASSDLAPENFDVMGALSASAISEADIKNGTYDRARLDFYACNWADLTQGTVQLRRGTVGEITFDGTHYRFEVKGLIDHLQQPIGSSCTRLCRYQLGEARCGVNLSLTTWRKTGTLTALPSTTHLTDTTRTETTGFFALGTLRFTSGANTGVTVPIKDFAAGSFFLWQPLPHPAALGDAYEVIAGCDKNFTTCQTKFSNAINFGGFPHIPGRDQILVTPNAKAE